MKTEESQFGQQPEKEGFNWTSIKTPCSTLPKRSYHAACTSGGKMYVFGGYDPDSIGILGDFYLYDATEQKWTPIEKQAATPTPRHSHTMVALNTRFFVYGGMVSAVNNSDQLYCYNTVTGLWEQIATTGDSPGSVDGHCAVVFEGQMWIYGGYSDGTSMGDLFSLNLTTLQWSRPYKWTKTGPPRRSESTLTVCGQALYIMAGRDESKPLNDLWEYTVRTGFMKQIPLGLQDVARTRHSCVSVGDCLVIFGGTNGVTHERNDLLIYNVKKNQWSLLWDNRALLKIDKKRDSCTQKMNRSRRNSEKKNIPIQGNLTQSRQSNKYQSPMRESNYGNPTKPRISCKNTAAKMSRNFKDCILQQLRKVKPAEVCHRSHSPTVESLSNSILLTNCHRQGNSLMTPLNAQPYLTPATTNIFPKPRDGHSAQILGDQMLIFGGDRHLMSYNEVISIDLSHMIKPIN